MRKTTKLEGLGEFLVHMLAFGYTKTDESFIRVVRLYKEEAQRVASLIDATQQCPTCQGPINGAFGVCVKCVTEAPPALDWSGGRVGTIVGQGTTAGQTKFIPVRAVDCKYCKNTGKIDIGTSKLFDCECVK